MLKGETLIINKRFLKRNGAYTYMDAQTSLRAVSPGIMLLLVLVWKRYEYTYKKGQRPNFIQRVGAYTLRDAQECFWLIQKDLIKSLFNESIKRKGF